METLEQGEVQLSEGCLDTNIMNGTMEDPISGSIESTQEKGIWKAFENIMFLQTLIDPYSCQTVAPFTALANMKNVNVPIPVIQEAFNNYKASGKFTPGVGGTIQDGASFALEAFNTHFGTNIKQKTVPLNAQTIMESLESGSPICTGIKYGPSFFKNESDDGIIQPGEGVIGNNGHCITIVKLNTMDDILIKYCENYNGVLKYQIILVDFKEMRSLFFNNGVTFYE